MNELGIEFPVNSHSVWGEAPAEGPLQPPWGPGGEGEGAHPQKPIKSPDSLHKAPTDYTKPQQDFTKNQNIRQNLKILDNYHK